MKASVIEGSYRTVTGRTKPSTLSGSGCFAIATATGYSRERIRWIVKRRERALVGEGEG